MANTQTSDEKHMKIITKVDQEQEQKEEWKEKKQRQEGLPRKDDKDNVHTWPFHSHSQTDI